MMVKSRLSNLNQSIKITLRDHMKRERREILSVRSRINGS